MDFKPGPESISLVNGLFVTDYLGIMAKHNIEQADYWDVHNNLTEQGCDYGYLSCNCAPDGDNVPLPSYHAFKLASDALRGRLAECKETAGGAEADLTCYLAERPDKSKAPLLVNKHAETRAEARVNIPGFKGRAKMRKLDATTANSGPTEVDINLVPGPKLMISPHSAVTVTLE